MGRVTETMLTPLTPSSGQAVRDEAAAAARRLVDAVLQTGNAQLGDLAEATGAMDAITEALTSGAPGTEERLREMWACDKPRVDAATGVENPLAPPLVVHGDADGWVEGRVTLPIAYQGQPSIAHGGVSALMVDHTFGVANNWAGNSGSTARLVLNYRKPVPLFTPLTIRAKQVGSEGRKIWTEGTLYADGVACVEAEALFVQGHFPRPDGRPASGAV